MVKNLNRADGTLGIALLTFLLALYLKMRMGTAIWLEGLLFCSEAALVGGIADWFAVKALFEKPLGISYHTRIIPKKREQIIKASVRLVRNEFFSRRNLLRHIKNHCNVDQCLEQLYKERIVERLTDFLLECMRVKLRETNEDECALWIESVLKKEMRSLDLAKRVKIWGLKALHSENAEQRMDVLIEKLRDAVDEKWVEHKLQEFSASLFERKFRGVLGAVASLLAQKAELVHFAGIARIICAHLREVLLAMQNDHAHPIRRILFEQLETGLIEVERNEVCRREFEALKNEIVEKMSIEEPAQKIIKAVIRPQLYEKDMWDELYSSIKSYVQLALHVFIERPELKTELEKRLQELLARLFFEAREMMEELIENILGELTEEQLNRLLFAKVKDDLIWIRMNGCIVGAAIGLMLFMILQVADFCTK